MTSIEEAARRADSADLDVVEALFEAAVEELEPRRGGYIWARREGRSRPAGPGFEHDLADDSHFLVVGTIDGVVVGYAAIRRTPLHDGSELAVLTDVYVLAGARGVGVGEAMLDLCLAWAEAAGCIGVDSLALPGDRETKNFFESFGLVARAIIVHRSLGDAG